MSQQSPLEQYFSSQTQGSFSSQATNLLANRPSQNTLHSNRLLSSPNIKGTVNGSKRNVAQLMDIFNGKQQKPSSQSGSQKDVLSPSSFFISMTNPSSNPFSTITSVESTKPSSQNAALNPIQNNLDTFLTKSKSSLSLASTIDKEWLNIKFQSMEEKVSVIQQKQTELQEEVSTAMMTLIKKMDKIESVLEKHQYLMEEQYSLLSDKIVELNHDVSVNFGDCKKTSIDSSQNITKSVQDCEHKIEEIKGYLQSMERKTLVADEEELPSLVKSPLKIAKQCKTKTSQKVLQYLLDDKAAQLLKPRKQEPIMLDDSWFCDEL